VITFKLIKLLSK